MVKLLYDRRVIATYNGTLAQLEAAVTEVRDWVLKHRASVYPMHLEGRFTVGGFTIPFNGLEYVEDMPEDDWLLRGLSKLPDSAIPGGRGPKVTSDPNIKPGDALFVDKDGKKLLHITNIKVD